MATTYKAQAMAKELADRLKARLNASLALVQGFDTDQSPYISIGAGTAASASAMIKVMPVDWPLAQDILGLTANSYTPHKICFVTEARATNGAYLTRAQLILILGQLLLMGSKVEWYESTNGDSPDLDDITAAKLVASFEPDLYYPMISSQ
jgi:hypothetical protein